jgi:hypothetical protein
VAVICNNEGGAEVVRGHFDRAEELFAEALELAREIGNLAMNTAVAANLAELALTRIQQDPPTIVSTEGISSVKRYLLEALDLARQSGNELSQAQALQSAASCALYAGDHQRSARLYGAADARREKFSFIMEPSHRKVREDQLHTLGEILTAEELATAYSNGTKTSVLEAITLVRDIEIKT